MICGQSINHFQFVLLSPWADLSFSGETFNTLSGIDPILSQEQLSAFANMYVQKEEVKNPLISSVYGDYKDFPPMMIIAGSHEILLSDSTRIAQKAMNQKVEVILDIFNGLWHVFCADPTLPESKNAIKKLSGSMSIVGVHLSKCPFFCS